MEKTEQPTGKRLGEARNRGQVSRSMEVNSVVVLTAAFGYLLLAGGSMAANIKDVIADTMALTATHDVTTVTIWSIVALFMTDVALLLGPFIAVCVLAAITANVIQNKPNFSTQVLKPDVNRISPKGGIKRIFGLSGLTELVKGLAKVSIVAAALLIAIVPAMDDLRGIGGLTAPEVGELTASLITRLVLAVLAVLIPLAIADYVLQKRIYLRSLKMTKQEVKDEARQQDLPPEIKSALRQRAMQIARQRMMAEVPTATVVITNPTHFAVALRYSSELNAPMVVAKGKGHIALKIREIAGEHGVPIVENPPLARGLYAAVDLNQEIPVDFFTAVVEVLTFVHRNATRRQAWV